MLVCIEVGKGLTENKVLEVLSEHVISLNHYKEYKCNNKRYVWRKVTGIRRTKQLKESLNLINCRMLNNAKVRVHITDVEVNAEKISYFERYFRDIGMYYSNLEVAENALTVEVIMIDVNDIHILDYRCVKLKHLLGAKNLSISIC